jgi:hypothetical protein
MKGLESSESRHVFGHAAIPKLASMKISEASAERFRREVHAILNVLRACPWIVEEKLATTPISRFAKLVVSAKSADVAWLMAIRQHSHHGVEQGLSNRSSSGT